MYFGKTGNRRPCPRAEARRGGREKRRLPRIGGRLGIAASFFVSVPGTQGRPWESATVALRYRITDPGRPGVPRGDSGLLEPVRGTKRSPKPIEAPASVKARGEEASEPAGGHPAGARAGNAESEYLALEAHDAGADARVGENLHRINEG